MSDMLQSLLQKADETCQMGIAAFTRLAAVLRLVLRRMICLGRFSGLARWATLRPLKRPLKDLLQPLPAVKRLA